MKYANLQADPRVLVLAGDTAWAAGLDVVLEGVATRVTDPALLEEVAGLYRARWDGRWRLDVRDGAFVNDGEGGVTERPVRGAAGQGVRLRQGRPVQPDPLPVLTP